ncbi:hypothetical protein PARA125_000770 [Parachlamydia sp. AcF125]|nr:hypothetical protein [Parachlamydia sp. AcF125]
MSIKIKMTALTDTSGQVSNIIPSGEMQAIIGYIESRNVTTALKFIACMECLS